MAKALFGHVGSGNDLRLSYEVRRLRARVAELEAELTRARAVNEALGGQRRRDHVFPASPEAQVSGSLVGGVDVPEELRALDAEPALT
jgi:hypothetical protein